MKKVLSETKFLNIRIKSRVFSCLFILAVSFSNLAMAVDSYVIQNPSASVIDEHSECRLVVNQHASGSAIMVPTKTANEWSTGASSFNTNTPAGITLGPCNNLVYSWGSNSHGQIGIASTVTPQDEPIVTFTDQEWKSISVGNVFSCGIKNDNKGFCWGQNVQGRLGDGTGSDRSVPTPVSGGFDWTKISAGGIHSCGIRSNGAAYCWGGNANGRMGDGTTTGKDTPTLVSGGFTWLDISAGHNTCGIRSNGAAYCWGRNNFYQLGDGTQIDRTTPTLVSGGFTWKKVSASTGVGHSCGIRSNDEAYCWGSSALGRQGDGETTFNFTPTLVSGGFTWIDISAGQAHTCGVRSNGAAYCWGDASDGKLGNGATSGSQLTPSPVSGGLTFTNISAGSDHSCGLTNAKDIYCWGSMVDGKLGNGLTSGIQATPVLVAGGHKWSEISAGLAHSAGIIETSDPCETGPIGTRCTSDGAIYAGDTVGGARMYAAACDHGMTWNGTACTGSQTLRNWKTSNTTTAGTTSLTDGVANTDAMTAANLALHPAAQACRNIGAEWYLPARDELDVLYDNLVDQDGDNTPGGPLGITFNFDTSGSFPDGHYWSSSEFDSGNGWFSRFSEGFQNGNTKVTSRAVRCVRR